MSIVKPLEFTEEELNQAANLINRIKEAAKNCGYSQRDLSIRSGLTQSTISNIFLKRSGSITALIKLSKAVHYDLHLVMK